MKKITFLALLALASWACEQKANTGQTQATVPMHTDTATMATDSTIATDLSDSIP